MHRSFVINKTAPFFTRFTDTGAIPSVYASSTTNTASTRVNYFQRAGKKARREQFRRDLFLRRAATVLSEKSEVSTNEAPIAHAAKDLTSQALLRGFFLATTPFVALKTRRRGKRLAVKIAYLERARGERKALQALSSHLHRNSKQTGQSSVKVSAKD
jgi:hypothetical protein